MATGLAIVGLFRVLLFGSQLYTAPPVAFSWLIGVLQSISLDLLARITGEGLTVMVVDRVVELPHNRSVIRTEYGVVVPGVARGLGIEGLSKDPAGLQLYRSPPDAFSCVLVLLQILVPGLIENEALDRIDTLIESTFLQVLASVTVTKYLVVLRGVAMGVGELGSSSVLDGCQL